MTKTALLALALLALSATASFAQRGTLSLAWNNCRVNGGGLQNFSFSCGSNIGNGPILVGGFIPSASANLNSLNSAFLYVDIFQGSAFSSIPLDPWWQFTDPPVTGCRQLNVWSLDMGNAAAVTCDRSYWGEVGPPSSAARWFYPTYAVSHGTLRLLVAVDAQAATVTPQIGAGEESHIFGARLGRANSSGAGSCAGCLNQAHLYFAQADLFQTNGDNFVIDGVGPPNVPFNGQKCASWQVPNAIDRCPVGDAIKNTTWGALKSLYR